VTGDGRGRGTSDGRGAKRHAIVVGASSGFGAATGAALRRSRWIVTGISRRPAAQGSADQTLSCDVTDPAALQGALDQAETSQGPARALVWCAGTPVMGRTLEVPVAAAREAFETTFWAMQTAVRAVVPGMVTRGQGAVLVVLSIAALRAVPHEAYYGAAKAAAARWLECLAHEVEPQGVAVKLLYPGFVDTGFLERGGWWGMASPPHVRGSGVAVDDVARAACELLEGRGSRRVLGWRERAIVLGDRVAPGLYDRVLRLRGRRG
jgi:short-subunit dehydrogenase